MLKKNIFKFFQSKENMSVENYDFKQKYFQFFFIAKENLLKCCKQIYHF